MRFALLLLFVASLGMASEGSTDGLIPISNFVLSKPPAGKYAPWRNADEQANWFAGETIEIKTSSFHYATFTDVVGLDRPQPDYSGPLKVFTDHIYLDHPGICYPYRVAGRADGVPVLLTWAGYEEWRRTHKVTQLDILYLQKQENKEPNNIVQPTVASRSAQVTNRTSSAAGSRR
ncbi:MAG TPA: hypothetical protein VNT26_12215 [Candidatus Sulfotelmatobacter sp.]|nr:hypothetical protein [Candidatus Sulfotelmatobacter sp.]